MATRGATKTALFRKTHERDYDRLMRKAADEGTTHYGVLFTSRHHLPRSRETISLYVRALDDFLGRHPAIDAILNSSRWLPDRPIT